MDIEGQSGEGSGGISILTFEAGRLSTGDLENEVG